MYNCTLPTSSCSGSRYIDHHRSLSPCIQHTSTLWSRLSSKTKEFMIYSKINTGSSAISATWATERPQYFPFESFISITRSSPNPSGRLYSSRSKMKNHRLECDWKRLRKKKAKIFTYNTRVSPDPGCILTDSSSGKLFNLNKQEYVSAQ